MLTLSNLLCLCYSCQLSLFVCYPRSVLDSVTKLAYDCHLKPYESYEVDEASAKSMLSKQKISMLEENLR